MIISCWRARERQLGRHERPEGGEGVVQRLGDQGVGRHDALAAVVAGLPRVLLRIELVLLVQRLQQRLVGFA